MIRLAVRVLREDAELVLAELLELAPAGVEEVSHGKDTVEFAVYGAPGEIPRLPDVEALAGGALVAISTSEVPDDWQERWKEFHKPVLIEPPPSPSIASPLPALRVRPPWEPPAESAGGTLREIVIDPGQAFGTGAHATTRLCLELLLALAAERPVEGTLVDLGTGSGVLAIAAAILGFDPVLAFDNERASVEAANENAIVNSVVLDTRLLDLRFETVPLLTSATRAPLVVTANLLGPLLRELAARISSPPSDLIAGGLLAEEADEISAAFAAQAGLRERERRYAGEWAALWLSRD